MTDEDKKEKKNTKRTGKGRGNQKTKRRRESKEHAKKKQLEQPQMSVPDNSNDTENELTVENNESSVDLYTEQEKGINPGQEEDTEPELNATLSSEDVDLVDVERSETGEQNLNQQEISEVSSLTIDADEPMTQVGQSIISRIKKNTKPIAIKKQLLPGEDHLNSKLVVYFDEWQIIIGFIIFMLGVLSPLYIINIGLIFIATLSGSLIMVTGYATEEVHITSSRIMVRRMNWIDRFFRIPKDSQYIINEIVSFDLERAPMNQALFVSGLVPPLLYFIPVVRNSGVLVIALFILSLILIAFSQRLGKRTIAFSMSGGHRVHLGIYKGIPQSVVEAFIDIVMEKNVFESNPR